MRGRPRLPTAVKRYRGTLQPCRQNPHEPAPRPGTPQAPAWLGPEAAREWKRIVPLLRDRGLLEVIDRAVLTAYCTAWEELVIAQREMIEQGSTTVTARGAIVAHPAVKRAQVARQQIHRFGIEFGVTPASRARVHAAPPPDPAAIERASQARRFFGTDVTKPHASRRDAGIGA